MTAQRLMLLDTASLYFRAFFGVPDSVQAPDGTPVNAVRGLLDFISRLVDEYQPTHLVCCWDNDWRPQWRVDLHPVVQGAPRRRRAPRRHPGHRGGARPARRSRCRSSSRCSRRSASPSSAPTDYEADDVIGTLATGAGMPVDIVTGDRDLFQLVDDAAEVRVLYIARGVGKHERVTEHTVRREVRRAPPAVRRLRDAARRHLRRPARRRRRGRQDRRLAAACRTATWPASVPRPPTRDSALGPGPRAKIIAAARLPRRGADRRRGRPRHRPGRAGPRPPGGAGRRRGAGRARASGGGSSSPVERLTGVLAAR